MSERTKPRAIILTRADCLGCRDVALNLKAQGYDVTELDTAGGVGQMMLADVMAALANAGLEVNVEFPVKISMGVTEAGV